MTDALDFRVQPGPESRDMARFTTKASILVLPSLLRFQLESTALITADQLGADRLILRSSLTGMCALCVGDEVLSLPGNSLDTDVLCRSCHTPDSSWQGVNPFLWLRFNQPEQLDTGDIRDRLYAWFSLFTGVEPLKLVLAIDEFYTRVTALAEEQERALLALRPDLADLTLLRPHL